MWRFWWWMLPSENPDTDEELIALFREQGIPFGSLQQMRPALQTAGGTGRRTGRVFSAQHKTNIDTLKESIAALSAPEDKRPIVGDLLQRGDLAILVTPIDSAAPKGRLILPQQQTIRDVLDSGAGAVVVKRPSCLTCFPAWLKRPASSSPTARLLPQWPPLCRKTSH